MQRVTVAPAPPLVGAVNGGPCSVLAQRLRALRPALPSYLNRAPGDALASAWSVRLGCG